MQNGRAANSRWHSWSLLLEKAQMEKPQMGDSDAQFQNTRSRKENSAKIFMQKTVALNVG